MLHTQSAGRHTSLCQETHQRHMTAKHHYPKSKAYYIHFDQIIMSQGLALVGVFACGLLYEAAFDPDVPGAV